MRWTTLSLAVLVASIALAAAPPGASAGSGEGSIRLDRFERQLIRAINGERRRHGLRRLYLSSKLRHAADYHSREMMIGNYFAHRSRNGWNFGQRIHALTGMRRAGEVLAWLGYNARGRAAARQAVRMWMTSPGHRAQILTRDFTHVGAARRIGNIGRGPGTVITVDLARRR